MHLYWQCTSNMCIVYCLVHVFTRVTQSMIFWCAVEWLMCLQLKSNAFLAIQFASCRGRLLSYSLFNWPGLKGVLHKAAESTAGVCVSGVRAKFSKSSQCVSQWQHMLDSLQRNSRTHNLTCKHTTDTQVLGIFTVTDEHAVRTWCMVMYMHTCMAWKCMQIREIISHCILNRLFEC